MDNINFADMLKRLEEIADTLDSGESSLEDSLKLFEEASRLIKCCNKTISDARLRINDISQTKEDNIDE